MGVKLSVVDTSAHWVSQNQIVWPAATDADATYRLHFDPNAALELTKDGISGGSVLTLTVAADSITGTLAAKFPHLANLPVLTLGEMGHREQVMMILKQQSAVSMHDQQGALIDATGIQIPGVLDDLFAYDGPWVWSGLAMRCDFTYGRRLLDP
ncbi:MAG: hypothetical protein R2873_19950 [Caldilineaceae bacterium]